MTGGIKISQYNDKQESTISNLVDNAWICRYTRPTISMFDYGNYFLGHAFKKYFIKKQYGINPKCATMENLKVNPILEQFFQFILNLIHMFELQNN